MFLLSELDMKVVARKSRTALAFQHTLKVPQSVALLKLRFGAIRTPERCDPAERECGQTWLSCPHCKQAVMQCEFTARPDLVGHLAYRCTASYPWKLRALRQTYCRLGSKPGFQTHSLGKGRILKCLLACLHLKESDFLFSSKITLCVKGGGDQPWGDHIDTSVRFLRFENFFKTQKLTQLWNPWRYNHKIRY